jgi:hypothetical protein
VPLFVGHGLSLESDTKSCLKIYMTKAVLRIFLMMARMLGLRARITDFGAAGINRCFGGLYGTFREAYNTGILQVWYLLIEKHFILLHVDFEEGNRTLKKKKVVARPHFISHSALFKLWCALQPVKIFCAPVSVKSVKMVSQMSFIGRVRLWIS